jgi:Mce-associated membrane protein
VRERRPVSKWSAIAAAVAAALFVGSAAFAGATMQPYLTDRATVATKLRVARTAANAITTLWTYTPQNIDKLADRASQYLSGDFAGCLSQIPRRDSSHPTSRLRSPTPPRSPGRQWNR